MRQRSGLATAILALPLLAACHTFTPVDPSQLEAGQAVRVRLTPAESANRVEVFGSLRESVDGTVRQVGDGGLGLTVAAPPSGVGGTTASAGLRSYLELPWNGVVGVEAKRMDWLRTGLLAAGAAVATVVILEMTDISARDGGEGGNTNEQRVRIPLLSIVR